METAIEETKKIWSKFVTDFHTKHALGQNTSPDCARLVNKARGELRAYGDEDSFLGTVTFIRNRISL